MPLLPLAGHHDVRTILGSAVSTGELPQSILLHGPSGIGKERLGLWLAQRIVCEDPHVESEPCGGCAACRSVLRLEHPDVHWFFPLPRPSATSPDKLREKLEEQRAGELQARRENPLHVPSFDRAPAHYLAAVQTIQQIAGKRPSSGSQKVFVVGDADAMVPQESSPEAANAFLKLLEEPPPQTTLILTTERIGALLPTIRSRVLPVRLRPLRTDELVEFLTTARELPDAEARQLAGRADGSIGRAVRLLSAGGEAGPLELDRRNALELLQRALASPAARLAVALAQPASGARSELPGLLDALVYWLRDLAALSLDMEELVINLDQLSALRQIVHAHSPDPTRLWQAIEHVERARALALGNVNPQLIIANLGRDLGRAIARERV